jgi:hypothetical protein
MRRKRLLYWLVCVVGSVSANAQSHPSGITVDESRSRIHTTDQVITPVLAIENPGSETTAHIRAELLDTADIVRASGEVTAQLRSGMNQISIPLSGWTQKSDEWNDSIWYRVRYRVNPSQPGAAPVEGILALVAKADGIFDLRVVASKYTVPGMPFRVRVYTQSLSTLLPMAGVQISAQLEGDEDATLKLEAVTNSHGYAQFDFRVPSTEDWGSSASLKVVARKGQVAREADDTVDFLAQPRFFTTTDKPLYQPGQVVHIRTLLQDWTKHAVAKTPVTFTIEDEDQTLAFRATAETSRFGVARADWEVPEHLRLGEYAIKITPGAEDSDDEAGYQTIRIGRYELPTFTVNVAPDRGYYLPGQNAKVTVSADYLFGKPVSKGRVKVARETEHRWNFKTQRWETEEEQKWEGETDSAGKFVANINLSEQQEDLRHGYGRFSDLDYAAYLTDSSTGKTEQRRFRLRITRDPIHLYVVEASSSVGQLPLEFYISASYADGTPAQCDVAIYNGSPDDDKPGAFLLSVRTNRFGVAKVRSLNLPPLSPVQNGRPTARLVLEATDHNGLRGRETQDFWDPGDRLAIQVATNHALYRPDEPVDVDLYTNRREVNLLLDVLRDGRILQSQSVRVRNGHAYVVLPYTPDFQGELTLAAYSPLDAENQYNIPMGMRTVLYPHDPALKVTAKFDHATYRPGDDAVLDLHVRGASGAPVEAALGSVIFDQAVEERARTDAEFGRNRSRSYGFYDSFRGYWYAPAELGGLKREDLDHLDVSEPFSDDLQLVAEVLFMNRGGAQPMVFGGTGYPDGIDAAFRKLLDNEVAPIKKALDDAYFKGTAYPHDEESLRRVLTEQGVDFDKVVDPWGSPFRATFSFRQSYAVAEFVSLGPDKKLGTADDVTGLTVQRWYFRPIADAIKKSMVEYHNRTGGYIRDLGTLKTEVAKGGVQWDGLRDPWGQSYLPQFGVSGTRYTLTVMSGGPDGKFETVPTSDDFPVWTDFSDYFSDTEVKIDSALARHFAATQKFPQNEDEFYALLDDAHISRDLLVDAWGRHARLVFDTQARFADRIVMDYSEVEREGQTSTQIRPETSENAFIHLYSPGADGIPQNADDFELAVFSREVARQNSIMLAPAPTPGAIPLSGGSGAITGVVTDPSGAVVANSKITAQLYDQVSFDTKTDSAGRYTLRNLPTGFYTVKAELSGFRTAVVNRVPVKNLSTTELNLRLTLGTATETVMVEAQALVVETQSVESSSVGRSNPQTAAGGPIATPRLREFFPETLLWEPMLETDRRGNSRLRFKFADSITNWKLSLIASTVDGQIGLLDSGIKTFQPFFIEHDPPSVLTQGDEISLPVVLRNYLEKPQTLRVEMKRETWFTLKGPPTLEASVAAGASEQAVFPFRVTGAIGHVKQRVTAANRETGDAVEKPLRIHPDGEPRTVTSSRLLGGQTRADINLDIEIPDYAMPGSVQGELKLYPNLMAHVLESAHNLLERPYGCGEQTVSSTYPNVMLLRLYKQSRKPQDEVYRAALHFARLGYERLLSYQHADGGISVWTQDKPDLALTAYALRFMTDASEFVEVDPDAVESARQWLLHQQAANGSWHEEWRKDDLSVTAYVTLALAMSMHSTPPTTSTRAGALLVEAALNRAVDYLRRQWTTSSDPYAIAQVALAAFHAGDKPLADAASARLLSMAHHEGDASYWSLESNTLFYGWGTTGRVETTALAVQALTMDAAADHKKNADNRAAAEQGLIFLIRNKDGYGVWYSGQTTINVLESFLLLAQPESKPRSAANLASTAEITVNGEKVSSIKLPDSGEVAGPVQMDLSKFLKPGHNHISISRAGESQTASVQAVARYYIPWDQSSAKSTSGIRTGDSDALALRVHYDHTAIQRGEVIHCKVHAERIGFRGYGMLLAEIGLPPGAVVDRESLEQEISGNGWEISQYEIRPDNLVVYLWPKAGGTDFDFAFRARYGMNALTAPSFLYDYYNPDSQVVVPPTRIAVQ